MALTKIKLDSMVTGTLPDANVPDDITITGLSGTNSGDNAVNTNYSGLAVTSNSVTDGTNTFNKATDFVSATSGGTFGGAVTMGSLTSTGIDDNADATAITIDSSENVGIGTTSISEGKLRIEGKTGGFAWAVGEGSTTRAGLYLDGSNHSEFYMYNGSGTLTNRIQTNGDSYFNGGNVGIGTSSTTSNLEVATSGTNSQVQATLSGYNDQTGYRPELTLRKSHTDSLGGVISTPTATQLGMIRFKGVDSGNGWDEGALITAIQDGSAGTRVPTNLILETYSSSAKNANQLVLHNDGNVGIGTASPESWANLQVESSAGTYIVIEGVRTGSDDDFGNLTFQNNGTQLADIVARRTGADNSSSLLFKTADAGSRDTQMTIDPSGNVGIGHASPESALHVVRDHADQYLAVMNATSSTYPYGLNIHYGGADPDSTGSRFLTCSAGSTVRMWVFSNGSIQNDDNSYGSTSDERIKQGIKDANSQWDDIKALKVRNFKKNGDVAMYGDKAWEQIGVVAQELEESGMGKLVEEYDATDDDMKNNKDIKEGDKLKTVKYSVLYMKAIKALQEAMTKIETLETKVTALENA